MKLKFQDTIHLEAIIAIPWLLFITYLLIKIAYK